LGMCLKYRSLAYICVDWEGHMSFMTQHSFYFILNFQLFTHFRQVK